MGKCIARVQKSSLMPNAASHNNASWYTDTDGFLEHSLSGEEPLLQGADPPEDNSSFWGVLPHTTQP